jgi:hypothetical protein
MILLAISLPANFGILSKAPKRIPIAAGDSKAKKSRW